MSGIYDNIRKMYEQEDDKFNKTVEVDLSLADKAWFAETVDRPNIPFYLDLEYRDWGLKSINVFFRDKVMIGYTVVNQDTDEAQDKEVEVDLSNLKTEWAPSGYYGPESMYLVLGSDGAVDYEKSYITVCYIKQ